MRKIVSKERESKRKRRNQWTVGIILILLMFFSTLGYAFQLLTGQGGRTGGGNNLDAPVQIVDYNGFNFESRVGFWTLNKDGANFIFRYNPNEVDKSFEEVNKLEAYSNKVLYINSNNNEAKSELRANLLKFVDGIEEACLVDSKDCNNEIKKINCSENFIKIREVQNDALEGIKQEGNCVFINAKEENIIKMTDEFLFKILGIEDKF